MNNLTYLGLLSFSLIMATGQILFKLAADSTPQLSSFGDLTALFLNKYFLLAGVLYALATVLWVYLLQSVSLSKAYPFAALGFVIVPAASAIVFHDVITPKYMIGAVLIIAGIIFAGLD